MQGMAGTAAEDEGDGCGSRPPLAHTLLFVALLTPFTANADLAGEASALAAFRAAVGPHVAWNITELTSVCTWTGVTRTNNRVTALRLPATELAGTIPPSSLGNLTALQTLSLRYNALSGPLPADLASAASLRSVFLNGNRLSGDFPPAFLALPGLVHLALGNNALPPTAQWATPSPSFEIRDAVSSGPGVADSRGSFVVCPRGGGKCWGCTDLGGVKLQSGKQH